MKNISKSLVLVLGAALLILPALRANDVPPGGPGGGPPDGNREMRHEKMGERLAQELGLSDDQKASILGLTRIALGYPPYALLFALAVWSVRRNLRLDAAEAATA